MRTPSLTGQLSLLSLILVSLCATGTARASIGDTIDLAGAWTYRLDRSDEGVAGRWWRESFGDTLQLPGSLASNGIGDDITLYTVWTGGFQDTSWYADPRFAPYVDTADLKIPFLLQPTKKYTGVAWYQRRVTVAAATRGPLRLHLERCHWTSQVWINGELLGSRNSLSTPHEYTYDNRDGAAELVITVRMDNRVLVDIGHNSHSITDHTQSNWNGIIGKMYLVRSRRGFVEDVAIYPEYDSATVRVRGVVRGGANPPSLLAEVEGVSFDASLPSMPVQVQATAIDTTSSDTASEWRFDFIYRLGDSMRTWDEFDPALYELTLSISGEEAFRQNFGVRAVRTEARRIYVNDRQTFLRGTLECAIFPLTGYPPTELEPWRRIYRTVKAYRLNHVRFHSWCPPEAAFAAADELGVYLQVEAASWPNLTTTLGDGKPVDAYVAAETERILDAYGNHPSFILMASGNEPGGDVDESYLTDYVQYFRQRDRRRLYTGAAGWPALAAEDVHNLQAPRIQGWGEELNSVINARPPSTDYDFAAKMPADTLPVIAHEIGQWCAYPALADTSKYTGVLRAKNHEVYHEVLARQGLAHLADSFVLASGKLQVLCYKADIEAALRTPNQAGFQLLDLHDFPGQGTAPVGVLNAFWQNKGYVSEEEYRRFCNRTVPLVRLDRRVFTEGDTLRVPTEVAHFGANPLQGVVPKWSLRDEAHRVVAEGELPRVNIPLGNGFELGEILYSFPRTGRARRLNLSLTIDTFENQWDLWVYPEADPDASDSVILTDTLNPEVLRKLNSGATVLYSLGKGKVAAAYGGDVGVGFSSIFWNTVWTGGQKPHTLGILCDPRHPALAAFPTEYHADWQWWDAMSHADAIDLGALSTDARPIVRIIDDWVTGRNLALLFEARVGRGRVLISGVDLVAGMDARPEARQLLRSLRKYMVSADFRPAAVVNVEQLSKLGAVGGFSLANHGSEFAPPLP